jgi:hypothetical protein
MFQMKWQIMHEFCRCVTGYNTIKEKTMLTSIKHVSLRLLATCFLLSALVMAFVMSPTVFASTGSAAAAAANNYWGYGCYWDDGAAATAAAGGGAAAAAAGGW